jgi:hypothetical protein
MAAGSLFEKVVDSSSPLARPPPPWPFKPLNNDEEWTESLLFVDLLWSVDVETGGAVDIIDGW